MHIYMYIHAEPSASLYTRAIGVTAGVLHSVFKKKNRPRDIQIHEVGTTKLHFSMGWDEHTD